MGLIEVPNDIELHDEECVLRCPATYGLWRSCSELHGCDYCAEQDPTLDDLDLSDTDIDYDVGGEG
jgi:hypothetical protein